MSTPPQPADELELEGVAPPLTDRVLARASSYRLGRLALWVIALPFYLVGLTVALLWAVACWCAAAVQVGYADANSRLRPSAVIVELVERDAEE